MLELDPTLVGRFTSGLHRTEARARNAGRRVGAPAEITEGDAAIGGASAQHELDPAVILFPLNKGISEKDDAVAVAEFKPRRRRGGTRRSESEEGDQGGVEQRA